MEEFNEFARQQLDKRLAAAKEQDRDISTDLLHVHFLRELSDTLHWVASAADQLSYNITQNK